MARNKAPLWLRRTAKQVVAQWIARRVPSQWCDSYEDKARLQRSLCLELICAVAEKIPDRSVSNELSDLYAHARGYRECATVGLPLAQCPVGLFWCGDTLALKTEYGSNEGRIDAYIVESGEFFWGDAPQTIESQRQQIVRPISGTIAIAALKGRGQ